MAGLLILCQLLDLGWLLPLGLLCVAYLGQDLAHLFTGEPTFQRSYERSPNPIRPFLAHSYFLLPLCLAAARQANLLQAVLSWFTPRSGCLRTQLRSATAHDDLAQLRTWALGNNPAVDTTTHWWSHALPQQEREAFERIAASAEIEAMLRDRHDASIFAIDPLPAMNELYVASTNHERNSDAVFYTDHVDGPFMVYPGATVYRCIVAANDNAQIRSCFPMAPAVDTLTTGDVGAFDFNREVHRIDHAPGTQNAEQRVTLNLHYCVYPRAMPRYGRLLGKLSSAWDVIARRAFLEALRPATLAERALAGVIIHTTSAYSLLARYVGGGNLSYLMLLLLLDLLLGAPIFLIGSSFVHYLLYVGTYYTRNSRGPVAFDTFKRDAMLYKTLAALQLAYYGLRDFQFEPLALTLINLGLTIAAAAARAIGMDRTYFGAELRQCEPRRIDRFPYNVMPHPMIIGNIIALIGVGQLAGLDAAPYLVPAHIACYLLHLLQEHFDWHRRENGAAARDGPT